MAYQCSICGKKGMRGNRVSHSKQRTKHIFRPNLRWTKSMVKGEVRRVRVCMDCLKKVKGEQRVRREASSLAKATKGKQVLRKLEDVKIETPKVKEVPEVSRVPKISKAVSGDLELAQKIVGKSLELSPSENISEEKKPKRRGRPKKTKAI